MNTATMGGTLRLLGQIVAAEVGEGKKMTLVEVEEAQAEIDMAAVEGLEGYNAAVMTMIRSLEDGNCNSSHRRRCRGPNSVYTDFPRAADAAPLLGEVAGSSDSTAVAEQTMSAAVDGTACTTPWLDSDKQ